MRTQKTADVVIIGAGIVGLSLARALCLRYGNALRILMLEKEPSLGRHSSGRNSGVLHSGVYYEPGSLKAKMCAEGAKQMAAYCLERRLPYVRCGKIIVPTTPQELEGLQVLRERADANGTEAVLLNEVEMEALEPEANRAMGQALFLPATASFDPVAILTCLADELRMYSVTLAFNQKVEAIYPEKRLLQTRDQTVSYGVLLNAAGLHADTVAQAYGLGDGYAFLPFKGLYATLSPQANLSIQRHIYPVPNLQMPFLGVHVTHGLDGSIYLGPTALPALGRENYQGLQGVNPLEASLFVTRLLRLYLSNPQGFRRYAHQEGMHFLKPVFARAAQALVPRLQASHLIPNAKVGIRPQLVDRNSQTLVLDFVVRKAENSIHILNAISPAFTSAFAFAHRVIQEDFDPSVGEKVL